MNVDREQVRHPVLEKQRHQAAAARPQEMRHAIAFERMKSLEEQKRLGIAVAGGIALIHGREIGAHGLAHGADRPANASAKISRNCIGDKVFAAKFSRQMIGKRVFQPLMLQDRGMREAGELRFGHGQFFRLHPQRRPDRIATGKFFDCTHGWSGIRLARTTRLLYH